MKLTSRSYLTHLLGVSAVLGSIVSASAQTAGQVPIDPAFSPDNRQFVYRVQVKKGDEVIPAFSEIWIVNADGTGARRLTNGFKDEEPRFSPDGRQIVFNRDYDIWLMNADGTQARNITNTPDDIETNPEFTNDGQRLFFIRSRALVQRNLADGAERILLDREYNVEQVAPQPGNDNLIFIICKPLDATGKPVQELTLAKVVAAFHLDGSGIATLHAPPPGQRRDIRTLRAAANRIIFNARDIAADFSSELQVFEIAGGVTRIIPGLITADDIARDGSRIVFVGISQSENAFWGIKMHELEKQTTGGLAEFADAIPAPARKHFEKGSEHFDEDLYVEAIAEFTSAIALHPNYAEAFYYRGWAHDMKDDEKAALRDLTEAIRLDPSGRHGANAHDWRAKMFERQDRFDEALADYSAVIAIEPENDDAYYARGAIYLRRSEFARALADFDKALELNPASLSARLERGDLLLKQGNKTRALADYSAAIQHFPNWAGTYEKRAKLYRSMGQPDKAAADEKKFSQLKTGSTP